MGLSINPLEEAMQQYMSLYKATEIECDKHGIKMVRITGSRAFCPKCAVINTAHDEALMINKETAKAMDSSSRWLRNRSVVTNKDLFKMRFDTFETMDSETATNKEKALDMARAYYKGYNGNNILVGKFGTGKTHLAMAILNQINEFTDKKVLFVQTDELMRRIKASFNNKTSIYQEDLMVELLVEADLLVLDDLGAEVGSIDRTTAATDFNVRVINGILNGRTNKPTIFTTNLSMQELNAVYDGRLVSRMFRGIEQEDVIIFKETPDKRTTIQF